MWLVTYFGPAGPPPYRGMPSLEVPSPQVIFLIKEQPTVSALKFAYRFTCGFVLLHA